MMRMNKKVLGVAALAAMATVGGTFAYFNQTMTVENPFDTAKYGTVTVEDFKPEDGEDWEPGVEVNKDVNVVNTGDKAVVVRMKFQDAWADLDSNAGEDGTWELSPADSLIWEDSQRDPEDGLVKTDKSVVKKNFENSDQWTYNDKDGYYYYNSQLKPTESTGTFLTSVQLLPDVDMGVYKTSHYYTTEETTPALTTPLSDAWVQYEGTMPKQDDDGNAVLHNCTITELVEGLGGYSNANYTLNITIETVQATDKAVAAVFGSVAPQKVVAGWNLTAEDLPVAQQ